MRAAAGLALALVLPACAAPTAPASAPATVDALIGEARCDSQAQCRTIAVGAKACGGPAGYRAWSVLGTDETALRRLAEQQAQAQREANAKAGLMSNCAMVADPGAVCRPRDSDGIRSCQLAQRPAPGGAGRAD